MATPKINISSLEFDDIKTSLKDYLKSQSIFSDYDFNGSAISALLDVLAYNTLYYSFYSNMIANETYLDTAKIENNIVSLVKPLGYLVPSKTCSKIQATVTPVASPTTLTAYTDFFTGTAVSGNSYRFYTTGDNQILSDETEIELFEAVSVVRDLPVTVNLVEQKAFLANLNVDITSIRVKVNGSTWTKYETFQANPGPDSEVYFVDRTSSGFYLIFGRKTLNDYQSSFGKTIQENDVVLVSYLVPTGQAANGVSTISNGNYTINENSVSSGGKDSPDLDLVKFFAPKLFASNDRAVTKDDYYGLLFSSNLVPESVTNVNQMNVWGGEEAEPPSFGRVFFSFSDTSLTKNNSNIKKIVSFLKNKSVVTITPEYVQSQPITAEISFQVQGSGSELAIKQQIENYYNTTPIFNQSISILDIKETVFSSFPGIKKINIDDLQLSLNVVGAASDKFLYFKNELEPGNGLGNTVTSSKFTFKGVSFSEIQDKPIDGTNTGTLVAVSSGSEIQEVGTINYETGILVIRKGTLPNDGVITIKAKTRYPDTVSSKNEQLLTVSATVTRI